jgi:hypothetical protein
MKKQKNPSPNKGTPVNKKTRLRVQHQHKQYFTAAAIARAQEQVQQSTCKLRE